MPRFSNRVYKKKPPGRDSYDNRISTSDISEETVAENCEVRQQQSTPTSSTSKKLYGSQSKYSDLLKQCDELNINEIINISLLSKVIENSVLCKECSQISMSLFINRHVGIAAEIVLQCKNCQ